MLKHRYIEMPIVEDLGKKMVFISGPRQVGKTTLAHTIGKKHYPAVSYLNWDNPDHRKVILENSFDPTAKLLIFDELHKYRSWKQDLKGLYDTHRDRFAIIVTGSARLDIYRRGGDSLMGRYHAWRLHPFTLAEIIGGSPQHTLIPFKELPFAYTATSSSHSLFESLRAFGGFPEPLFAQNIKTLRRWQNERLDRIIREDIRDIESVRDLSALQVLVELLPNKVSSPLSLNALREDLQVAHKTITLWIDILERFYYHFRVYPFASTLIKSLRRQPKIYLWDWSQIEKEGARFENIIASHLLKLVHFLHDSEGYKAELFYLRDIDGHEVDFLVTVNKKPWFAVEAKQSDTDLHAPLLYFGRKLKIPYLYQVTGRQGIDILKEGVRVISVEKFLTGLV